jgi:uncharacterized membrane protein YGL010W
MKTIHNWLDEYGESHKNNLNKLIHWICVPAIYFSIVCFLSVVKFPFIIMGYTLNLSAIIILLVLLYYAKLSPSLMVGMFLFSAICLFAASLIEIAGISVWLFSSIVFAAAWVGQFYGHKVEGKKPSFLKDIQFLMIGPAWLLSFLYKKMGIKF